MIFFINEKETIFNKEAKRRKGIQKVYKRPEALYKKVLTEKNIHQKKSYSPGRVGSKKEDFSPTKEKDLPSKTILFLSLQISHNKQIEVALHNFASFLLRCH